MVDLTPTEKLILCHLVKNEIVTVESDDDSAERTESLNELTALLEKLK
jgi:hypothetical protein